MRWKASVQRYEAHVLRNVLKAHRNLLAGKDIRCGFVRFDLMERGKLRHITSVRFSERVIQKSISRQALAPAVWPTLTPGCSANMKGRGTDYALIRLKRQLAEHQRRHGTEGYILLIDFSDYFGSISHEAAKALVAKNIDDPRVRDLIDLQIDASGDVGLGLGSEPNQILAVAIPSPIDHLLERLPGIEASGRYMGDTYAVAMDKETLRGALREVRAECERLGITINERKTRIVKLTRGFTFLKKHFRYTETGRIIVRPCRKSLTRERRKMKKHAAILAPKFHAVLDALDREIAPLGIADYKRPVGGYFVSLDAMPGTARRALELCRDAGVTMTAAGATFPYGVDPQDSNIRIAPSLPPVEELQQAIAIFCLCVKLAALEKLGV